jgi:sec-independent protein translocase protein TatA
MLLFFDISTGELLVILLAAFIVFGPSKLPEIARKIGRGMNEIRRASDEIKREIDKEVNKIEQDINANAPSVDDLKKTTRGITDELKDIGKKLESNLNPQKKPNPKK